MSGAGRRPSRDQADGRLHVVGTGLIGASFALAARRSGRFRQISGSDIDAARLERAVAVGAVDGEGDPRAADAVLVAVPVGRVAEVVAGLCREGLKDSVTLFDVGSAKQRPIEELTARLGRLPPNFVPCHPMAGSEQSGPEAADAALFRGRRVFVTPQGATDSEHLERVRSWWRACGAEVRETTPAFHDRMVALTSHLPHLLAAAFLGSIDPDEGVALKDFAGPGFADFTRIAGGDPELWRDIAASNRDAIRDRLAVYLDAVTELARQLDRAPLEELERVLGRAQRLQRALARPETGHS